MGGWASPVNTSVNIRRAAAGGPSIPPSISDGRAVAAHQYPHQYLHRSTGATSQYRHQFPAAAPSIGPAADGRAPSNIDGAGGGANRYPHRYSGAPINTSINIPPIYARRAGGGDGDLTPPPLSRRPPRAPTIMPEGVSPPPGAHLAVAAARCVKISYRL